MDRTELARAAAEAMGWKKVVLDYTPEAYAKHGGLYDVGGGMMQLGASLLADPAHGLPMILRIKELAGGFTVDFWTKETQMVDAAGCFLSLASERDDLKHELLAIATALVQANERTTDA